MTSHEHFPKLSQEELDRLSLDELTDLCFERQFPDYQHNGQPIGYIPADFEVSLAAIHDLRPARAEFWRLTQKQMVASRLGRLITEGQLQNAEAAVTLPSDALPVYEASRQFYSDRSIGKWLTTEGGESEHFKIINRVLLYKTSDGRLEEVPKSKETLYEFTILTSYYAQSGRENARRHQKARYEAEFNTEEFIHSGSITPPWDAEELFESELRQLLIEWGQLDQESEH